MGAFASRNGSVGVGLRAGKNLGQMLGRFGPRRGLDLAWISESAEQVMALGLGEAFSIPGQVLVGPRGVGYDSVLL